MLGLMILGLILSPFVIDRLIEVVVDLVGKNLPGDCNFEEGMMLYIKLG
jgi:hypothetical protein